jgi:hypothetical protein
MQRNLIGACEDTGKIVALAIFELRFRYIYIVIVQNCLSMQP